MERRAGQLKTYGRSTAFSKQKNDFDKVFCEGSNSTGNSPFGTSDSSTGRSVDLSDSSARYNLRGHFCNSLRDMSNESSTSQDSMTTPHLKPPKYASQRDKGRRKLRVPRTIHSKQIKSNEKENSFVQNVPDYDAIAEDSFVVENENKISVTNCSTPLAMPPIQGSDEIPTLTPIFQVPQSIGLDSSEINNSPQSIHTFSPVDMPRSDYMSSNVTTRRSSRLKTKLVTSRKLLIEEDHQIISLTPKKNVQGMPDYNASLHRSIESLHEKVSVSDSCDFVDRSSEDILKQIGTNISNLAAINLSLDEVMVTNNTPPSGPHHSPPCDASKAATFGPSFDASHDLFCSHENSNQEGLSFIPEEDTAYDEYLYSIENISESCSRSILYRLSTHSINDQEQQTAQEKLLEICDQVEFIPFSTCIPHRMMNKCVKIGEGVYGEVFRSVSRDQNVALKIIPIEGNFNVNDCPQKTYEELLPEAVIAKELSDLACGFCQVNRISCVQGCFPAPLLKQWDAYAQKKLSENDRPDLFPEDQLFAVFEFADGGSALENFEMANHKETLSVLRQAVFALAVAENNLEFEHRDLHIGNILVRHSQESTVKYAIQEEDIEFASEGVIATIIDFTISRLKKDGCAVFCDVSTDDGLFEGSGDIQFDVYRDMRERNENDWSKFCPSSNILWVHYLCKKMLTVIKVKENGREHRESLRRLRQLNEKISKYESCYHLAMDRDLWEF